MKIERISSPSEKLFLEKYVAANKPVIVTDAFHGSAALAKWTPDYMVRRLGDLQVQVYDDLFNLIDVCPLGSYIERNFGRAGASSSAEYMRWYSKLKDIEFMWADEAFERLRADWSMPAFMPTQGYAVPDQRTRPELRAERDLFPYRGLFISGRGARTRLHRDPWTTSAMLCQFYGTKSLSMFAPEQAQFLVSGDEFADPSKPDLRKFPRFHEAIPAFEDELHPGEVLFIPDGWLHDVTSLSDSISITWNFVHDMRLPVLREHLQRRPDDAELQVLGFFLTPGLAPGASAEAIRAYLGAEGQGRATGAC